MAVFALAAGDARDQRDAALAGACRRLEARAGAGHVQQHGSWWSLWLGAVQAHERSHFSLISDGGITAVFDGWMRNARELAVHCGLDADSDPAPIMRALLQREGAAGLSRVRGGYAALVIDDVSGSVLLARDPTGMRPLFFRRDGQRLLVASSELAVLDAAQMEYQPEPSALAAFVALRAPSAGTAFLRGVEEVAAGTSLRWDAGSVQRQAIDLRLGQRQLRMRAFDDYAHAWCEVLGVATRDAAARGTRAAVALSGGIDSSALAAVAPAGTAAVSWRLPGHPDADESQWIDAVVKACGLALFDIVGDHLWPLAAGHPWPMHLETPLANPYRLLKQAQWRAARAAGVEVLLSGDFGDHIYPGERVWLRGALRQWRLLSAGRQLWARAQQGRLWRDPGVRGLAAAMLGRAQDSAAVPRWLTPAATNALVPLSPWPSWAQHCVDPQRCSALLGLDAALHAAQDTGFSDREGLLIAHPYRDERVIDLALSIPIDVFTSGGMTKALTRHALTGRLPDPVRLRPKSGSLAPLFRSGIRSHEAASVRSLLFSAGAHWPHWLDHAQVSQAVNTASPTDADDLLVWLATSVELWFRGLSGAVSVLASAP